MEVFKLHQIKKIEKKKLQCILYIEMNNKVSKNWYEERYKGFF